MTPLRCVILLLFATTLSAVIRRANRQVRPVKVYSERRLATPI